MKKLVVVGSHDDPQAAGLAELATSLTIDARLLVPELYGRSWHAEITNEALALHIEGQLFGTLPTDPLFAYFRVPSTLELGLAQEMDLLRELFEAYSRPNDVLIPKRAEGHVWSKAAQHLRLGEWATPATFRSKRLGRGPFIVAKALNATTKMAPAHADSWSSACCPSVVMTQSLLLGAHMKTHAYRTRSASWLFLTVMLTPSIGAVVDDSLDAVAVAQAVFEWTGSRFFDWDYVSTEHGARIVEVNSSPAPLAFVGTTPESQKYVQRIVKDWVA